MVAVVTGEFGNRAEQCATLRVDELGFVVRIQRSVDRQFGSFVICFVCVQLTLGHVHAHLFDFNLLSQVF
jgi:hypothetical protein